MIVIGKPVSYTKTYSFDPTKKGNAFADPTYSYIAGSATSAGASKFRASLLNIMESDIRNIRKNKLQKEYLSSQGLNLNMNRQEQ